jgi:uncharacterized protein GlcG (DUF336 family)
LQNCFGSNNFNNNWRYFMKFVPQICAFLLPMLMLAPTTALAVDDVTLAEAQAMIAAAEKKAAEIKLPMNIAVVDAGGNLVAFGRMKDSILVSIGIATDKAWTAAAVKLPIHVLATVTQPGQSLYGINTTNNGRVVVFGGGYPVKAGAQTIGGIGVSGGSVEQDMEVAQAGLAALKR